MGASRKTTRISRIALRTFCIVALLVALPVDAVTPLGVADWLIEIVVAIAAVFWGTGRDILWVAWAGTIVMLVGAWTSPQTIQPFWIGFSNRLAAIAIVWVLAHVARAQREAEDARWRAMAEIKILCGLLPICASCKAIRNPAGEWSRLESYLAANSEAQLTHSICPECFAKDYPDFAPPTAQ